MTEQAGPSAKPRTWRPMALWTAAILLALGLAWFVGTVAAPVWQVRRITDEIGQDTDHQEARGMIMKLGGQEAAVGKLTLFIRMPDSIAPQWNKKMAAILLGFSGKMGADLLLAQVRTSELQTRFWTIAAIGHADDHRAVEPLISALSDREEVVRAAAASGLGRLGDHRAVSPLLQALTNSKYDPRLSPILWCNGEPCRGMAGDLYVVPEREACVQALGKLGDACAIPMLEKTLDDEDEYVRTAAVEALKKIRGEEAKP